ncbi:hypothetical protein OG21DRAFT_1509400 [Imleria badia]|nr:hypothetical protein OG21DRAFT_1509400 [Imleria badia]
MSPVPLIPNGVYKIWGGPYVANLSNGTPSGNIVAGENVETSWIKWRIQNRGDGGNQVTIENILLPGIFAYVEQENTGAPLVGSPRPTLWTLVKLDEGTFYIQTEDGQNVWELPRIVHGQPIVLHPHSGQVNQKWRFDLQE